MKIQFLNSFSQREKEVVKLYKTNLTQREIAKQLAIGESTLGNIIRKLGLKRPPQFKYKGYNVKQIKELRKLGLTETEISKKLGISWTKYLRVRKLLGLYQVNKEAQQKSQKAVIARKYNRKHNTQPECPNKTNILEKYHDDIIKLLESGVSKTEIARRYNVSTHTVFNFIYLCGIRSPLIKKTDNEELILKLYNQGYSHLRIANQLGCSFKTINDKIKQLELKRERSSVKKAFGLNLQEDLIQKLYMQGLAGDEIAKQVHAHPVTVYNKIRKMKLIRPQKWADYKSKQSKFDNKIVELRHSGRTYKEIGDILSIPYTTVSYRFKRLEGTNA